MTTINFPTQIDRIYIGEFNPKFHEHLLSFIDNNNMDVCIFDDNNRDGDPTELPIRNHIYIGYEIGKWWNRTLDVSVHCVGEKSQHIMIIVLPQ